MGKLGRLLVLQWCASGTLVTPLSAKIPPQICPVFGPCISRPTSDAHDRDAAAAVADTRTILFFHCHAYYLLLLLLLLFLLPFSCSPLATSITSVADPAAVASIVIPVADAFVACSCWSWCTSLLLLVSR